jgi:hypothetical protein
VLGWLVSHALASLLGMDERWIVTIVFGIPFVGLAIIRNIFIIKLAKWIVVVQIISMPLVFFYTDIIGFLVTVFPVIDLLTAFLIAYAMIAFNSLITIRSFFPAQKALLTRQ